MNPHLAQLLAALPATEDENERDSRREQSEVVAPNNALPV
jgi:hypothetical protein